MRAEHRGVHRLAVGRLGAVAERELQAVRERVGGDHVVAAADERLHEEEAGEAAADDEDAAARDALDRPKHAGERLGERPRRVVDLVGERRSSARRRPAPRSRPGGSSAPESARRSSRAPRGTARTRRRAGGGRALMRCPSRVRATTSCPRTVPARRAADLLRRPCRTDRTRRRRPALPSRPAPGISAERRLSGAVENDRPHGGIVGGEEGRGGGAGPASAPVRPQLAARPTVPAGSPPTVSIGSRLPSPLTTNPLISGTPPARA